MQTIDWNYIFLNVAGVCLAFFMPAALVVAVIILKRIKLTRFVLYAACGVWMGSISLILSLFDPRHRGDSWSSLAISSVLGALGWGVLVFVFAALSDGLLRIVGLSKTDTAISGLEALRSRYLDKAHDQETTHQGETTRE